MKAFSFYSKILLIAFFLTGLWSFALPKPTPELEHSYYLLFQNLEVQGYLDAELKEGILFIQEQSQKGLGPMENTRVGSLPIEEYLASENSGYDLRNPSNVEEGLIEIIQETQSNRKLDIPTRELILGDAYHWLGHVYEDRKDFVKAFEAHARAYFHYRQTSYNHSPRINSAVEVHEHSIFHLQNIKNAIVRFVSGMRWYRDIVLPRQSQWESRVACAAFFK